MNRREIVTGALVAPFYAGHAIAQTPPWAAWGDLLNALPTAGAMNAARNRRGRSNVAMEVQKIESAAGHIVNFDTYAVDIKSLPNSGPSTQAGLFNHIRVNLPEFLDPSVSTLGPFTAGANSDATDWAAEGNAPLGSVMVFKIPVFGPAHEKGAVVTSISEERRWVFTPVKIGSMNPGEHPVCGNREFGIRSATGMLAQIYTRAADRPTDHLFPPESEVFKGADALWRSFQKRVVDFIVAHGGAASAAAPVIHRPSWESVRTSGLFRRS